MSEPQDPNGNFEEKLLVRLKAVVAERGAAEAGPVPLHQTEVVQLEGWEATGSPPPFEFDPAKLFKLPTEAAALREAIEHRPAGSPPPR